MTAMLQSRQLHHLTTGGPPLSLTLHNLSSDVELEIRYDDFLVISIVI
jgi:hypothetical protein